MSSIVGTIYLGLDVHKDSVTIAVLPSDAIAPTRVERLPNDVAKLRRFCERLRTHGEVRACYEASGAGYVLHRAMTAWGVHCDVIAPRRTRPTDRRAGPHAGRGGCGATAAVLPRPSAPRGDGAGDRAGRLAAL